MVGEVSLLAGSPPLPSRAALGAVAGGGVSLDLLKDRG